MPSQSVSEVRIIVIMGVSGCGKSTTGAALGAYFGKPYLDGDDFHPAANVEKMRSGEPLTDEDRWPWLAELGSAMCENAMRNGRVFAGCSALKRSYREALVEAAGEPILFIHLSGSRALIAERMAARSGHYMPTGLLDSQIATLEPPGDDEVAVQVDIAQPVEAVMQQCIRVIESPSR